MTHFFPAICKGDAVCTVLNICDVEHVGGTHMNAKLQ